MQLSQFILNHLALPDEEKDVGNLINQSIMSLPMYVSRFGAAAQLFEFSSLNLRRYPLSKYSGTPEYKHVFDSRIMWREWGLMAARDGAATIFNFAEATNFIKKGLYKCPTLDSLVDRDLLRLAQNSFRSKFPNYRGLRHASYHPAHRIKSPGWYKKHAVKGPINEAGVKALGPALIMISDSLINQTYYLTYEGKVISYEISEETRKNLETVMAEFISAFQHAAVVLRSETNSASTLSE